jgi:multidrug efflux pump subunit AcrA (membrane-fusion protein)
MDRKKVRRAMLLGGAVLAVLGAAALVTLSLPGHDAGAVGDPRQEAPLVRVAAAARSTDSERRFTGVIAARVQSNLGFRVPGKIITRLVDVGQQVKAGQPIMKIDESDLRLAVTAKRNAVLAAHAAATQARSDEKRYATLVQTAAASVQSPRTGQGRA